MENLELPESLGTLFVLDLTEDEQNDIIDHIEAEGQSSQGIDPVKVAKAIWKYIKKKIDDYSG